MKSKINHKQKLGRYKNIIEIIFCLYIFIAAILYFYINNLSPNELFKIIDFIEKYHFWGGGYTYLAEEYSKILNGIMLILTPSLIILLSKYRKLRTHHRKTNTILHYTFVISFLPVVFYFLLIKEWKFFSSNDDNYIREIPTYIMLMCSLHAWFISEFWYFIDMLEKLYKKIANKQDEQ